MTASSPAQLLENLGWVRALARRLVRDESLADDVAQDACVAAMKGTQRDPSRLRAWLGAIVRNVVRQNARADRARRTREEGASRPEAGEPTDELVHKALLQKELIAAVLALDEPYRATILLRFFDGLPPREIARQMQVEVATVQSRLTRALERLRSSLDAGHGGRARWLAAFVPLTGAPALPLPLLPTILMNMKLKIAAAALVAAGGITWYVQSESVARDKDTASISAREDSGPSGTRGGGGGAHATSERVAVPQPTHAPRAATASRATLVAEGRVCDTSGQPKPDVEIVARDTTEPRVKSDAQGRFAIAVNEASTFVAATPSLVTVFAGTWAPESKIAPLVIVAEALTLAGQVVDEKGAPIERATLVYQPPKDFEARLSLPLDRAERLRRSTTSGAKGGFELARLPRIEGATLLVLADAFRPETVPLPSFDDPRLQIVLQPLRFAEGELTGRVVDPRGTPVEGARVALGLTSVVSGVQGKFALSLKRAGFPTALVAAKQGFLPARLPAPAKGGAKLDEWPHEIELRLGDAPLSISGRVVDPDGKPIAGALVWVSDPEQLGLAGIFPIQLEYWLAGGGLPRGVDRPSRHADSPLGGDEFTTNMSHMKEPNAGWFFVTTDEGGAFTVPGLQRRDYTLRAADLTSAVVATSAPAPAGSHDLTIRLTREQCWQELKGRVVSLRGKPMPDVTVLQCVRAFHVETRIPGGRFDGKAVRHAQRTKSDADGRFSFSNVGKEHTFFSVYSDAIMPMAIDADEVRSPNDFVIKAEARCHFEVSLADPNEADRIEATDASGQMVELALLRSGSNSFETDLPLHDGKSGVVAISERATTLVLRKGDKLVREVPFLLEPGKTFAVR